MALINGDHLLPVSHGDQSAVRSRLLRHVTPSREQPATARIAVTGQQRLWED